MQYSPVGIANMALQRIGARGTIGSFTDNTPNAVKVNLIWNMVFQEVLSERDWKFAKTRVALSQNTQTPASHYKWAYPLPADFLRLVRPREIPQERRIADAAYWDNDWYRHREDVPVHPRSVHPYVFEAVLSADGVSYTNNLLTDYPGCQTYANVPPIVITYIRLITDFTQLMPGFVNCLANRVAAELCVAITEDMKKAQAMMEMYRDSLNSSQAQLECDDYLKDEQGSQSWVNAGRYGRWFR